jgi:hypothetical protein
MKADLRQSESIAKRKSERFQFLWLSLLIALFFSPALQAATTDAPADRTLTDTLVVLERAINGLATRSADYRQILQDTLSSLPRGGEDFVKNEITTFLRRAPATGADFKCNNEFLVYRARKELWRLKDTLLNANPQAPQPQLCYAAPLAVDVTQPINTLEIYGYDFDRVPIDMVVINSDGYRDVSFALTKKTHYHLTLNFGKDGIIFSPSDSVLGLTWGHLIHHFIPLIQAATPLCSSRIEEVPAGKAITYAPPVIAGGGRFSGPGANALANATLDFESNKVDATICMMATEQNGDGTTFSGCGVEYVYTSDSDRVIEGVFGDLQAAIAYTHANQPKEIADGAPGGPVAQWIFDGLGEKSPAHMEAQMTVRLPKIRVVSTQPDACVSAIAYSEARRMNALSLTTTDRLDAELKKIDSEILTLRPRFAPHGS